VKTNPELHNAGLGNWYIGALVLPSGQVLMSNARMLQVSLTLHTCHTSCSAALQLGYLSLVATQGGSVTMGSSAIGSFQATSSAVLLVQAVPFML
jgi:hypothetical protein